MVACRPAGGIRAGHGGASALVVCGGSAGHSALWAVDVAEGTRATEGGRFWQVDVVPAREARQASEQRAATAKAAQSESKRQARIDADSRRIVNTLAKFPAGETAKAIRDRAGMSGSRFTAAIASLLESSAVVPTEIVKPNRQTPYEGYTLRGEDNNTP